MNFMEAVKAMKEGKKVRRPCWYRSAYLYHNDEAQIFNDHEELETGIWKIAEFEATDWEIYEEEDNWNLADKQGQYNSSRIPTTYRDYLLKTEDIKITTGKKQPPLYTTKQRNQRTIES